MISKQECILLLLQRSLVNCSETIETISISNSARVSVSGKVCVKSGLLKHYAQRSAMQNHMSLHDFFHFKKNPCDSKLSKFVIPHYTGGQMHISYPINASYATTILNLYKPWRTKYQVCKENIKEYEDFVIGTEIPKYLEVSYIRSINNFTRRSGVSEPVAKEGNYDENMDEETAAFIDMVGSHERGKNEEEHCYNYDYGLNYDWTGNVDRNVSDFYFRLLPVL